MPLSRGTGWLPVIEEGLSPNIFLSSFTGIRDSSRRFATDPAIVFIDCVIYLSGVTSSLLYLQNTRADPGDDARAILPGGILGCLGLAVLRDVHRIA